MRPDVSSNQGTILDFNDSLYSGNIGESNSLKFPKLTNYTNHPKGLIHFSPSHQKQRRKHKNQQTQ
jgi:hypothetical protein